MDRGGGASKKKTKGTAEAEAEAEEVSPQDVLNSLMNDGTFDSLRHKIINQLKHNEELKKYTTTMVEQSQTLNTPGAEQKSKRELFVALREELEGPVLERASKAAWELILSKEGVGTEISETVYRAYNQLHGKEESHYSPPDLHTPIMGNAHEMQSHGYGVGQPNGQMQELCQTPLTAPKVTLTPP